jgi:hypothetical protein
LIVIVGAVNLVSGCGDPSAAPRLVTSAAPPGSGTGSIETADTMPTTESINRPVTVAPPTMTAAPAPISAPSSVPISVSATAPPMATGLTYPGLTNSSVTVEPKVLTGADACPAPPLPNSVPITNVDELDTQGVEGDIGIARAYAQQHPDEFAGVESTYDQPPPWGARIAFTGHVDEHRAALSALVAHPDRLEVVLAPYTEAEIMAIAASIKADPPFLYGAGLSWLAVDLIMPPGAEARADALLSQWGNALRITLGGHPYVPDGCGPPPEPAMCPDVAGADPSTGGITLAVEPSQPSIRQWETGTGHLSITNVGSQPFYLDSGSPLVAVLVAPGTNHVVGTYSGGIAGVGGGPTLAPGATGTVDILFGAARCDGQPGSAVPPGTYGLKVAYGPEGRVADPVYLSPEVPIEVIGG